VAISPPLISEEDDKVTGVLAAYRVVAKRTVQHDLTTADILAANVDEVLKRLSSMYDQHHSTWFSIIIYESGRKVWESYGKSSAAEQGTPTIMFPAREPQQVNLIPNPRTMGPHSIRRPRIPDPPKPKADEAPIYKNKEIGKLMGGIVVRTYK
jgi:hypothetical protein